MILLDISPSVWIVWAIIGIIGGYMCGRLLPDGPSTIVSLIIGLIGSTLGGWVLVAYMGSDDSTIYLSLVSSAILCAILLWLGYIALRRRHTDDS